MTRETHPCARGWVLPPEGRPRALGQGIERTNLRELGARPERFEHHLMIVAQVGVAQLELPVASEPLPFLHVNLSDEYVVPLTSGHPMLDAFPFRVFVSDPATNADLVRINHKSLELVLHPFGFSHWPGRLRHPYAPIAFPPDLRRAGLTLVLCASARTEPSTERALFVSDGRNDAVKATSAARVPTLLASLMREPPRTLAQIADVRWERVIDPEQLSSPRGGYLVVLDAAADSPFFATDLVYVPNGATLDARGVDRGLWLSSHDADASPPPASWDHVPAQPFSPFEEGERGTLPLAIAGLVVDAADEACVQVRLGETLRLVPRYWLARTLFRIALHSYRLGYVETYEGFFYDDTDGAYRLGLRGAGAITLGREELSGFVERLYRAVAPEGYVEHLS
jgi:hypothetical protein